MSSGPKQQKYTPAAAPTLQTTGYQGMGLTATPQSWTPESKPEWMQGQWDMPQWGTAAGGGQLPQGVAQQQGMAQPPIAPGKAEALRAELEQLKAGMQPTDPRALPQGMYGRNDGGG